MSSFLELKGLHVFITGGAGGIGSEAVREFLNQGSKVTSHDIRQHDSYHSSMFTVNGDISDEVQIKSCIEAAIEHHGPINVLIANAGITDESASYPIWQMPLDLWQKTYDNNVRGTFLTIKAFLQSVERLQDEQGGKELENIAIVVTGSETGKFGQAGHSEYASGKAGLQYGFVRGVKNEIVRLNSKARINAVAPGWVDTPLIAGRLDDPKEMWTEAQATVPLRKIAKPADVARAMAFLASHRAAGHISGECISVDGGMEGRIVWPLEESVKPPLPTLSIPAPLSLPKRLKIQILLSVDFDAISGWLGTGQNVENNFADYSTGYFAGQIGVPRLLRLFKKHQIASKVTWFIPGHSMETFPSETKAILDSGAEIGCHGYAHEGGAQMTEQQERDVIAKCVKLAEELAGKKVRGWRAPLYQLRDHTVKLLEEHGFLYDSSLAHHDSQAYWLPSHPPITPPKFDASTPASSWMHPSPLPSAFTPTATNLVEIPCSWYMEDMTPLQFLPHTNNSHGYVSITSIEQMWKNRFEFLVSEALEQQQQQQQEQEQEQEQESEKEEKGFLFPLVLHPDTSGMAHIIPMIDRFIGWLKGQRLPGEIEFVTYEDCARDWKARR